MSVTCYYSGRLGNIVFHAAQLIAYAKKYNLPYFIPTEAVAYRHFRRGNVSVPLIIKSTGDRPVNPITYHEPNATVGTPYFHEIPKMDNVIFIGYFQSFKYFDWCRQDILDAFALPDNPESGMTAIHVRRTDCVNSPNFPLAPLEYYQNAVKYMQERGFNKFRLYSDDIKWGMENFTPFNFPDSEIEFSHGKTELEDYISLLNCSNQITARSTFSLTAAWFNRNPTKIVLVPTLRHPYFVGQNRDLIPDYFVQIDFEKPE